MTNGIETDGIEFRCVDFAVGIEDPFIGTLVHDLPPRHSRQSGMYCPRPPPSPDAIPAGSKSGSRFNPSSGYREFRTGRSCRISCLAPFLRTQRFCNSPFSDPAKKFTVPEFSRSRIFPDISAFRFWSGKPIQERRYPFRIHTVSWLHRENVFHPAGYKADLP